MERERIPIPRGRIRPRPVWTEPSPEASITTNQHMCQLRNRKCRSVCRPGSERCTSCAGPLSPPDTRSRRTDNLCVINTSMSRRRPRREEGVRRSLPEEGSPPSPGLRNQKRPPDTRRIAAAGPLLLLALLGLLSPALAQTTPTSTPSQRPSLSPSAAPSLDPSAGPSSQPSSEPSAGPSLQPSAGPSSQPSSGPSAGPSLSAFPSSAPSAGPTASAGPTLSAAPSSEPSVGPTLSAAPSSTPTDPDSDNDGVPDSLDQVSLRIYIWFVNCVELL